MASSESRLYNGQRVIFVGNETYLLNQIMAVGKLPEKPEVEDLPASLRRTGCTCSTWLSRSMGVIRYSAILSSSFRRDAGMGCYPSAFSTVSSAASVPLPFSSVPGVSNILAFDATRAFIINIPHGRVITTMSQEEMQENI